MTAPISPAPGHDPADHHRREAVNHFDHIRSIIDAVFGPDDNSPVPTARTMTAAHDFTTCTGCGNNMPPAAFWLCSPCHQRSLDEAFQEERRS